MNPDELASLELSLWQRARDTLRDRRLRLIEKWRYRAFLASFSDEPGKAPYGVKQ